MNNKKISISLLLAIALGMTACGGGDKTPKSGLTGEVQKDTKSPIFGAVNTLPTIEEDGLLDVTTVEVTDDSNVTFSLSGADASSFELVDTTAYTTKIRFLAVPDFESQDSYIISIIATDSEGNASTKEIIVTIGDKPFKFDVTGSMGSVVVGSTEILTLATKEAKDTVSYTLTGDAGFSRAGNQISFVAPPYNETGSNTYAAVVKADDRDSEITLVVNAIVIKDGSVHVTKTYLLKSKREVDGIAYTEYTYSYDSNNSLTRIDKTGTNVHGSNFTTFEYSDDSKIMRGYKNGVQLESIRVFEDKQTDRNKFAATINNRLSVDEYINYLREISDTASFKNNRHLTKYIYKLNIDQTKAKVYVYNSNDTLSRELTGKYSISSDDIIALSDAQLHTLNAPTGGFPSADSRLNATQLSSLNSGLMAFNLSQETTYIYNNDDDLTGRKYFGYAEVETISNDVNVSYYSNDVIKMISSAGVNIEYDTSSLLDKVNNYDYSYNVSGQNVTVTITNNGQTVSTYNFEEE